MTRLASPPSKQRSIPPLENGDRLSADEFLRRYEAMPELKKAELINGVVFMPSPLRWDEHAKPDNLIQGWLWFYGINTPGVESGTNATVRLGPGDVPQPDSCLRILPECGGRSRVERKGYLQAGPELIVEIAASSASIDAQDKLVSYLRAEVPEYLLWRTDDGTVDWRHFRRGEYQLLPRDKKGIIRSQAFPGLWLNIPALLAQDGRGVLDTVQAGLNDPSHAAFVERLSRCRLDR